MVVRKSVLLHDGEIGISRVGVYTKAHFYRHPKTGKEVRMIGMLHVGEAGYYKAVQGILDGCDRVLYERLPVKNKESIATVDIFMPEMEDDIELFISAMLAYFIELENSRIEFLKKETQIFEGCQNFQGWVCGDIVREPDIEASVSIEAGERIYKKLRRALSEEELYERAIEIAMLIKKLKSRKFSKRDFARGMLLIYAGHHAAPFYVTQELTKRDLYCFEVFDDVVEQHNPQTVGIKYGAAHMPFQRKLLKKRGYEHISSKKLFCVRF